MLFNSYQFLVFFPAVVSVYFVIPKRLRYLWLLAASYYFYMCWNPKYALLIALSTAVTYLSGLFICRTNRRGGPAAHKKWAVAASFVINLGILAFFKYSGFIAANLNLLLAGLHIAPVSGFDVVLPVGISFYTFQALSYTVDVYRGDIPAERNPLRYALFVSFFPQLVAGPIERSGNLLRQVDGMEDFRLWDLERISGGLILMLWGLFQKMVLADRLAVFVDAVYARYWMYGTVELVLATAFFAVQLYCDFGSYSLIAAGAAKVMGFSLMENFNTPYFARSVSEFWRRWHISLSAWFRDYLYIPLGGSRCSRLKKYRNLMITFLVSGLWHGASWNFIVWGGLHGLYQVAGDLLRPLRRRAAERLRVNTRCMSYALGQTAVTFSLWLLSLVFFRMGSVSHALAFIGRVFTRPNLWALHDQSLFTIGLDRVEMDIVLAALAALLLADLVRYRRGIALDVFLKEQNLWFRWVVVLGLFFSVVTFGMYGPAYDPVQFIYFQF